MNNGLKYQEYSFEHYWYQLEKIQLEIKELNLKFTSLIERWHWVQFKSIFVQPM
jgi:hypothetical protein